MTGRNGRTSASSGSRNAMLKDNHFVRWPTHVHLQQENSREKHYDFLHAWNAQGKNFLILFITFYLIYLIFIKGLSLD